LIEGARKAVLIDPTVTTDGDGMARELPATEPELAGIQDPHPQHRAIRREAFLDNARGGEGFEPRVTTPSSDQADLIFMLDKSAVKPIGAVEEGNGRSAPRTVCID